MAITAVRMLEIMKARDVAVRRHPGGSGWLAETSKGTRLGGTAPHASPEDAVEAADQALAAADLRATEANAGRLFDVLSIGAIYAKPRAATAPNPVGGPPAQALLWDVFAVPGDAPLVTGERSLRAAIIEAERILAAAASGSRAT